MKLKDIPLEELELMGYDEIAKIVLEESGKKMKIFDIFKKVCNALHLSDADFENKITDFFEMLSTNKNFTMLENGYWDLRSKHNLELIIDDEEDESIPEIAEEVEQSDEDSNIFYETDDTDDEEEDDLQDLVVIDEEDEANSL